MHSEHCIHAKKSKICFGDLCYVLSARKLGILILGIARLMTKQVSRNYDFASSILITFTIFLFCLILLEYYISMCEGYTNAMYYEK